MKRVAVITSSDKGYRGEREDLSGPAVKEIMEAAGYEVVSVDVLPDDRGMLPEGDPGISAESRIPETVSLFPGACGADPDYGWYRVFSEGCDTGGYGGCDRAACAGDSGGDAGV